MIIKTYRCFFTIKRITGNGSSRGISTFDKSRTKEYESRKLIGFSMEQMYNVVADVENYKNFVPFCKTSTIIERTKDYKKAKLVIGFPPINESYLSKVTTIHPRLVKAECTDGKLFDHLNTLWIFSPGLKNNPQTCLVDISISFEFRSIFYSHVANLFFNEVVRQMENAFVQEAKRKYGRPCIKTVRLER
ncbi:coenzyme Q-binding protein COQ10 homolog B, mitochondrial [Leptopilina heterotoma]|uniref:coenzyme Q-binding protein COQ10 homolog B, mitochondrial n=1 Tax=Leptopilina heterotoma TaxID=63436 RepID=UPI001CA893BE|nr:coenzyme Q-binding protein COQ10 homolog B, mitochondrial [Leptopilina heterotoma]